MEDKNENSVDIENQEMLQDLSDQGKTEQLVEMME
jgi:hypothetical protein